MARLSKEGSSGERVMGVSSRGLSELNFQFFEFDRRVLSLRLGRQRESERYSAVICVFHIQAMCDIFSNVVPSSVVHCTCCVAFVRAPISHIMNAEGADADADQMKRRQVVA